MNSATDDIESDLPGFYYDTKKGKYFRITPRHASNPLHPENIRRIQGFRRSEQVNNEIRKRNSVSVSKSIALRQAGGPSRRGLTSFTTSIIKSAMSQLKQRSSLTVGADFPEVELRGPLHSAMADDIVCTAYARKGGSGSVVISSKMSITGETQISARHSLTNSFPSHKIVDLAPMKISNAHFAAVVCQALNRDEHFVSIRPMFLDDVRLDDLSKSYHFPATETLWSLCVTPTLVVVGAERKIEMIRLDDGQTSVVRVPTENVFALENDGELLFAGTNKGNVQLIDCRAADKVSSTSPIIRIGSTISNLKISSNQILVSGYDHKLALFDRRSTSSPLATFKEHRNDCRPHLSLSLNERLGIAASVGSDSVIRVWSLSDRQLSAWISEEEFINRDSSPCFVVSEQWGTPCSLLVSSGDTLAFYK